MNDLALLVQICVQRKRERMEEGGGGGGASHVE